MRIVDIIEKKRDGGELTREEIEELILGYVKEQVPDYQVAAFLMAVVFRGMTDRETAILTDVMMHSGDTVDLSPLKGIKVDKHSTGGVGDTTTLIVAPLVAACVGTVAKIKQSVKTPDGALRLICEGYARAERRNLHRFADYYTADVLCKTVTLPDNDAVRGMIWHVNHLVKVEEVEE